MIAGMRDAEIYPASFFGETFQRTHKILKELHSLEEHQIEALRKQMEEHQRLIASIPVRTFPPEPEIPASTSSPKPEVIEEKVVVEEKPVRQEELIRQEEPVHQEELIRQEEPVRQEEPIRKEEPVRQEEPIAIEKPKISLNEILEKQNLSDFRKAFSLNDRFHFRRELFGGDEEKMNKAIADLNDLRSYEESVTYLNNVLYWNVENASVADFIKLLEKRFL